MTARLLLDEDVWAGLAPALREAGYDAVSISELKRKGLTDPEQMAYAIAQNRIFLTHNIRDFAPLAQLYAEQEIEHPGIIVAAKAKGRADARPFAFSPLLLQANMQFIQLLLRYGRRRARH